MQKENSLQIFSYGAFGEVRVSGSSEEPFFCLADVCKILDLRQGDVRQRLAEGVVSTQPLMTAGGMQQANFVNEDGLYDVILDSRKPEAKAFRKWVTSEVLPSIRKQGGYMITNVNESNEDIMARALMIATETMKRREEKIKQLESKQQEDKPKVLFADAVSSSKRSILVSELAKILTQNGYPIGQNRLFKWLRENGYLCKYGEYYNQPTQKSMEMSLFELKTSAITRSEGTITTTTTKVTGKGQVYFVNKFLKQCS